MKNAPLAFLYCVISTTLFAEDLRIVNAASLSEVSVAPGSIVSIFGKQLTRGVAAAEDAQKPPATLGGVTVTIGGKAAALLYVSATQINAVLDAATPAGNDTVTVVSEHGMQTGTVKVAADAPIGLFSRFGSGTRDGAILNGKTFAGGDFGTRTSGSQTQLALFGTGPTVPKPTVTIGGVPVEVTYAGPAPCCAGLIQINVALTDALAGAGRVPIVATVNDKASNTVEVVLLPAGVESRRNRELASLAYVPNTSLVLSTDSNDDVVRVIDVSAKAITKLIALPDGANPIGIAVNTDGALAVVAESGTGKVAILDLKTYAVTKEVATGAGASSVAIAGTKAVVVNRDADTVTIVDILSGTVVKTLAVGRGPMSVAVDTAANRAVVTNQNDGTITLIDVAGASITKTVALGDGSVRPQGITLIPGAGVAFVTAPASGPEGSVLLVNLTSGETKTLDANPERSGGATDVAYYSSKVYFANQTGGSVSVLPVTAAGAAAGPIVSVKVDNGARALAVDVKDKLLVVSSQGTGMLVLVNLDTNQVVARVNGVRSGEGDDEDDRGDRERASNLPAVTALNPSSGKAGTTVALLISGANLAGATEVNFGPEHGNPNGKKDDDGFTVKNIVASADGKQIALSLTIDASVKPGPRIVRVKTPNGDSSWKTEAAVFTVVP